MDARELRNCFGKFATGVTVVTWEEEDTIGGITVNSYTSVSMDPPLVLVCIDRKARSHNLLMDKAFVVNILSSEQEQLAWQYAGRPKPDYEVKWEKGEIAPRLTDTLAYLECKPWKVYEGGDHSLIVGEVVNFKYRSGDALGFCCGKFNVVADPNKE